MYKGMLKKRKVQRSKPFTKVGKGDDNITD
jgi:hypothetical protein